MDIENLLDRKLVNPISVHSYTKVYVEKIEYLIDQTQDVARKYGAVCTPDFFGYNRLAALVASVKILMIKLRLWNYLFDSSKIESYIKNARAC